MFTLAVGVTSRGRASFRFAGRHLADAFGEMVAYAWVGGSIQGILIGAVLAAVVSAVVAGADWRARHSA